MRKLALVFGGSRGIGAAWVHGQIVQPNGGMI